MKHPVLPLLVASSLFLVGCNDLAQVREFATVSSQPEVYKNLVNEYADAPARTVQYAELSRHDEIEREAALRKKQVSGLLALHKALSDYMTMLGSVASDKATALNGSTDSLKAQIASLGGDLKLEKAQVSAVNKLIDLTASGVLHGYRQKELSYILTRSDKDVQVLVKELQFISGKVVPEALEAEEAALNKRYKGVLSTIGDPNDPRYVQNSTTLYQRRKELRDKHAACTQYAQALSKIGEGHAKLAAEANKMSRKDLSNLIADYKTEVKGLYDDAKDLLN